MCGIFGSVGPPVDQQTTTLVLRALYHRGPEGSGVQHFAGATLAHARLRINDLSAAAAQPMANEDATLWVTFNGEIYNFAELRLDLQSRGHHFSSKSDTEVIVHGYEEWGDDVVGKLDGMFAFGMWDCRKQRLFVARDRVGKKPVFYARHEGAFYFASEMKGLFAAGVPARPSEPGVTGFLAYGYTPPPLTPYRDVFELPPGHHLSVQAGRQAVVSKYWQVDFEASHEPPSERQAADRVRELLTSAVKKRLVADVPVGAFLSGGMDSTIIVGLMASLGKKVKTFAIGSAEPTYNEAPAARAVARHFGTEHTELHVKPTDVELLDKLVWLYDGPVGDSSAIPTYLVSQLSRKEVTVALTGDGGDEVFAGYLRFGAATATQNIPGSLRPLLQALGSRLPGAGQGRSLSARIKRLLAAVALPLGDRMAFWTTPFAFHLNELLTPALVSMAQETLKFHRDYFPPNASRSTLAAVLEHNFSTYLPCDLLVKVDRCTMAHALEARSPFLDHALIEYASKLPDNYKRRGRTNKYILRKAFADLVPANIAKRGKMGFGIPLAQWFRRELRGYLLDHLASPASRLWQYVQPDYVDRIVSEHMRSEADHSHQLWTLLAFEVWLKSLGRTREASP